jgi:hypothetical protein
MCTTATLFGYRWIHQAVILISCSQVRGCEGNILLLQHPENEGRWRHYGPLQHWYRTTKLHGEVTRKPQFRPWRLGKIQLLYIKRSLRKTSVRNNRTLVKGIYIYLWLIIIGNDRLCGLVVRVSGYRYRGPEFDSRRFQIFWEAAGLERGPLSLLRTTEELLERKVEAPV